jgi:hypothetical protein
MVNNYSNLLEYEADVLIVLNYALERGFMSFRNHVQQNYVQHILMLSQMTLQLSISKCDEGKTDNSLTPTPVYFSFADPQPDAFEIFRLNTPVQVVQ